MPQSAPAPPGYDRQSAFPQFSPDFMYVDPRVRAHVSQYPGALHLASEAIFSGLQNRGTPGRFFTLRYDHHAKLGRSSIDYTLESLSWPDLVRLLPIELFTDPHGLRREVPARLISQRAHVRLRARIGALGAASSTTLARRPRV